MACDRTFFHLPHDLDDGTACPGSDGSPDLTAEQIAAHADDARRAIGGGR